MRFAKKRRGRKTRFVQYTDKYIRVSPISVKICQGNFFFLTCACIFHLTLLHKNEILLAFRQLAIFYLQHFSHCYVLAWHCLSLPAHRKYDVEVKRTNTRAERNFASESGWLSLATVLQNLWSIIKVFSRICMEKLFSQIPFNMAGAVLMVF